MTALAYECPIPRIPPTSKALGPSLAIAPRARRAVKPRRGPPGIALILGLSQRHACSCVPSNLTPPNPTGSKSLWCRVHRLSLIESICPPFSLRENKSHSLLFSSSVSLLVPGILLSRQTHDSFQWLSVSWAAQTRAVPSSSSTFGESPRLPGRIPPAGFPARLTHTNCAPSRSD